MKIKTIIPLLFLINICSLSQAQLNIPQMKHRVLLSDEGNQKVHYIDMNDGSKNWSISLANRDMQLIGDGKLLLNSGTGYEEYDLSSHTKIKTVSVGTNIQTAFRINSQETFVGVDGSVPHVEIINNATGKSRKTINIKPSITLRLIRPTPNKTFLVGGKDAGMVYEFDSLGNKVWEANVGGSPYQAVRLPNGNTVISTGYGAQIAMVDRSSKIIRKFPKDPKDASLTSVKPNFFGGFQILKNGNIVVTNWQGHGAGYGTSGIQLLEFDSTGVLVSYWKQTANIISSLHGVIVVDDLDPAVMNSDINGVLGPLNQVKVTPKNRYSGFSVISGEKKNIDKEFTIAGKILTFKKTGYHSSTNFFIVKSTGNKKLIYDTKQK